MHTLSEERMEMSSSAPVTLPDRSAGLREHQALVRSIAWRLRGRVPPSVELDDLVQAGLIGLDEAITRFQDDRGASFETYARRRIEGAMLDELRLSDTLSRQARARQREIREAVRRLEHRLGRPPRSKEVATELGWTLAEFHRSMAEVGQGTLRYGQEDVQQIEEESALELADRERGTLLDACRGPFGALQMRQRLAALGQALERLESRERAIMEMIYDADMGVEEIGADLGMSPSRVSQLHKAIVAKLRQRLSRT
jgi:RNA polymerase sigma factor for flagellar operon FliA